MSDQFNEDGTHLGGNETSNAGKKESYTHTYGDDYSHTDLGDNFGSDTDEASSSENFAAASTKRGRLVGFLISFSGNKQGQYWPLCFGANLIGQDPSNHIVLEEAQVSKVHANIKVNHFNGELDYTIDLKANSQFLKVNGKDIRNSVPLEDDAKILIGGYEFLIVKINAKEHLLGLNAKFKSTTNRKQSSPEAEKYYSGGNDDNTNLGGNMRG